MSNKLAYWMSSIDEEPIIIPVKYDENKIVDNILKQIKDIKYKYKIVPIGTDYDEVEYPDEDPTIDEQELPTTDDEEPDGELEIPEEPEISYREVDIPEEPEIEMPEIEMPEQEVPLVAIMPDKPEIPEETKIAKPENLVQPIYNKNIKKEHFQNSLMESSMLTWVLIIILLLLILFMINQHIKIIRL